MEDWGNRQSLASNGRFPLSDCIIIIYRGSHSVDLGRGLQIFMFTKLPGKGTAKGTTLASGGSHPSSSSKSHREVIKNIDACPIPDQLQ